MWILPNNLPTYQLAPGSEASKEELNELLDRLEPSLMWKSKPRSLRIWWWAWKRAGWLRHLFGRILKPSISDQFATNYFSSWADIPASLSVTPASGKAKTIPDTYGRILSAGSSQLALFASSSKTSSDTSASDSTRSSTAFAEWVTQLRREYIQRQRLARHTKEQESLSLASWQTPKTTSGDYTNDRGNPDQPRLTLQGQAKWTTPVASDTDRNTQYQQGGTALSLQVKQWPTTAARDWKDSGHEKAAQGRHSPCLPAAVVIDGRQAPATNNTDGNVRVQLNPAWVAQLMGTTLEKIFFVPLGTE